jgi:hypothetical protein
MLIDEYQGIVNLNTESKNAKSVIKNLATIGGYKSL